MPVADAEMLRRGQRGCPAGDRGLGGCVEAALCRLGGWLSSGAPTSRASGKREGQLLLQQIPLHAMSAHAEYHVQ